MWKKTLASVVQSHYTPVVLAIFVGLLYLRYAPQRPPAYQSVQGPLTVAQEPRIVTRTVTRTVKVPGPERIVYLNKPEAAEALKMPELATAPDNVLAIVTVAPHTGNTTAISMLSPTGEGTILLRQEPTPFWSVKKEFGARAGMGTGGLLLGELYARPLRVGPVDIEARGYARRDDRSGADFGAALLIDWRF